VLLTALVWGTAALGSSLHVSHGAPELMARPTLVARLRETPHNYFRFVNRPFSQAVCRLFDDVQGSLPEATLHGDAHVEQYAVTSLGRGLTDFDDSARGPFVVDLVRFGVSLELVARENGWRDAQGAIDDFLRGYHDALVDPSRERPPRRTIRRARAGFKSDHGLALRRAEALMGSDPVDPSELESDFESYAAEMHATSPALPARFFRIKNAGRLALGIGSALEDKYLLRIEGPTDREGDDQILEAKLVGALPDSGCVRTEVGARRVFLGMSLIARAPFPYGGLFARGDRVFRVYGWTDDYVELKGESSFPEPRDLRQVAYDVGIQLGQAHPKDTSGRSPAREARMRLLEATCAYEGRVHQAIAELMERTVQAWRVFRTEAQPGDTGPPARSDGRGNAARYP
jgi:Uncharacterized protein conserved in bacteria (DUF2252)